MKCQQQIRSSQGLLEPTEMFKGANLYGATAIFLIVSQQYIKLTGLLALLKIRSIDFHACQIDLQHFIAAEAATPRPKPCFSNPVMHRIAFRSLTAYVFIRSK